MPPFVRACYDAFFAALSRFQLDWRYAPTDRAASLSQLARTTRHAVAAWERFPTPPLGSYFPFPTAALVTALSTGRIDATLARLADQEVVHEVSVFHMIDRALVRVLRSPRRRLDVAGVIRQAAEASEVLASSCERYFRLVQVAGDGDAEGAQALCCELDELFSQREAAGMDTFGHIDGGGGANRLCVDYRLGVVLYLMLGTSDQYPRLRTMHKF